MRSPAAWAIVVAAALQAAPPPSGPPAPTPGKLIAAIRNAQATRGFTTRLRLVNGNVETGHAIQIRVLGRRDGATSRVLCQALWPAAVKGRAVYIERGADQELGGFLFDPPDAQTPLTHDGLSEPFLESALSLEDLTEEFWSWPAPATATAGTVEGQACQVVELRPPSGLRSSYGRVRCCISPRKSLALSIEKIRKGGQVARRFTVLKTVRGETGLWVPVKVMVEDLERDRTTLLEVSKGERDISVPLAEFSIAKIKSFGR